MISKNASARLIAGSIALLLMCASALAQTGLIHRYSFKDGTAKDSVGHVDGTLKGAAKITDGKLVLDNGDKTSGDANLSYLDFGSSILPKSGSASLVIWVTAKENPPYSRILDIGDNDGTPPVGNAFIYLVPRHDDGSKAGITATDTGGKSYVDGDFLDDGHPHMAAIVIDGVGKQLHYYIDGKEMGMPNDLGDNTLDAVHPVHNYMGRSLSDNDPGLTASISEFRVYDQALTLTQITAVFKAGADVVPTTMPTTEATTAPAGAVK